MHLSELATLIREHPGPVRLVAVDGPGGAGKTTLVAALLHKAGAIRTAGSVAKGGTVSLARTALQMERAGAAVEQARSWGFGAAGVGSALVHLHLAGQGRYEAILFPDNPFPAHAAGSSSSTMPAMASSVLSRPAAYNTGARSWRTSIAVRASGS